MIRGASVWLVAIALVGCGAAKAPKLQDGDIVFQTSRSSQSLAIQQATGSRYSHMGMVLYRGQEPYVFEAVATVRYTSLGAWIARGSGGHFVAKRLRDASSILTVPAREKLRQAALKLEGRPYDPAFGWSDEKIYCSELVWKAYDRALGIRLGELQELRQFNLSGPEVKKKLGERYGDSIPLREPVIAPGAMFSSPRLETVASQ